MAFLKLNRSHYSIDLSLFFTYTCILLRVSESFSSKLVERFKFNHLSLKCNPPAWPRSCWPPRFESAAVLSPELADVSAAAGSSLISLGSTGRTGPLRGGSSERSVSASFSGALPLFSSTTQSSCSSEAPLNTLLPSVPGKPAGFRKGRPWMCDSVSRGRSYHDQHLGYQSLIAWTSSAQQLVITKPTCTWKTARLN